MTLLDQLPEAVQISSLTEWCDIPWLAKLDNEVCNKKDRKWLLKLFANSEFVLQQEVLKAVPPSPQVQQQSAQQVLLAKLVINSILGLRWVRRRNLKMKTVRLLMFDKTYSKKVLNGSLNTTKT